MNDFHLKNNRESLKSLVGLIIGISLVLSILAVRYIGKKTDFGDASAMGIQTVSIFSSNGDWPIHVQAGSEVENCLIGIKTRKVKNQAIWFGNSQLHAINQYHVGEQSAPGILAAKLSQQDFDLVTFSQGNANLQEHYVMFEYLRSRIPIRQIILPVVFDDLREDGLREQIADLLLNANFRSFLSQREFGKLVAAKYGVKKVEKKVTVIPQEYVENKLNEFLDKWLPIWAARPEMRGDLFVGLYRLRNTVFGITPDTKRKMIYSRYADNMAALEALLSSASDANIPVLMYVAPVGVNNGERPYVESEYGRFKVETEVLAKRYHVEYQNLENLIPENLWGYKDSTKSDNAPEFDFMHFTAAGHAVLADHIDNLLHAAASNDRKIRQ